MKLRITSLWSEFKAFAFKGNMVDLAVAVVIGTAFSGVINSLVKDVIMPSISYVTSAATTAASTAASTATKVVGMAHPTSHPATQSTTQPTTQAVAEPAESPAPPAAPPAPPAAPAANPATPPSVVDIPWKIGRIHIGDFIGSLLNFMLVAFAVFITIVKFLGSVMKKVSRPAAPGEPTTKECPECLSNIPYKAKRCAYCTAILIPNPHTVDGTLPESPK